MTVPQWYANALAEPRSDEEITVGGCRIHYLTWGEAGHHLMLDQPLSLLTAIRTLATDWDHSLPRTRGAKAESRHEKDRS